MASDGGAADHATLIAQFVNITALDPDRAAFYLESAGWQLQLALSAFYEGGGQEDVMMGGGEDDVEFVGEQPRVVEPDPSKVKVEKPTDAPSPNVAPKAADSAANGPAKPAPSAGSSSKFATIGSLAKNKPPPHQHGDGSDDSDSDDEDRKGQEYYVGGSEKSGQAVLGPPRDRRDPGKLVDKMFKGAKAHGAEEVPPPSAAGASRQGPTFQGAGYRLGASAGDSAVVGGPPRGKGAATASPKAETVHVVLRAWQNGISIDDGPLRVYDDPKTQEFMKCIQSGQMPPELLATHRGRQVEIDIENHQRELYKPPKAKPFSGAGQRLGSPTPDIPAPSSSPSAASNAPFLLELDDTKPMTTVQIRLADGSKITGKFNLTHTVGDVRAYVAHVRPEYAGRPFALQTPFPNRELSSDAETLEMAKLQNAVIVLRLLK